jgi:tetratricopeptide (TPR) repeat protein
VIAAGLCALLVLAALGTVWAFHWWPTKPSAPDDDSGDYHWEQAQRALEARDFASARQHLARCLEAWPFNAEACFLMARACRGDNDFGPWGNYLEAAQLLGWPADQITLEGRLAQAQQGDVWAVEKPLLADLQSGRPEEVLILDALCRGYLNNEALGQVLKLTAIWKKRHPDDWLAWLYHGRALHLDYRTTDAVAEYSRALELRPDEPEALAWRAAAYMTDEQFAQALADYQACLRQRPRDAEAQYGVAVCQRSLNDGTAARQALERLLTAHPDHVAGLLLRAKLDRADDKRGAALRWLQRAEAVAPKDADVLDNLARALRQLHEDEKANAVQRRFQDIPARKEELQGLVNAIHLKPDDASLRHRAGVLSLELGRETDAARWFRSALWVDPGYRKTHRLLADYYQKAGDAKRAAYHRRWLEGKGRPTEPPAP